MDQQTNSIHCGSCAVFSAFHWGTVLNAPQSAHGIPTHSSGAQNPSFSNSIHLAALSITCALRSRGYRWPFLLVTSHSFPHHLSSACCALASPCTSPYAKCRLRKGPSLSVKLSKIVGGLYPHRPLVVVEATREAVSSACSAVLSAAPPRALVWFSLMRADSWLFYEACAVYWL